jgi:hypothetical protein
MNTERLQKIAALIKKAAAPDNTGFDEKPIAEKNGPDPQVPKEPDKQSAPPAIPEEPKDDIAASPAEDQDQPQGMTMQDIMSVSARGFLGPEIFQAAMGGDQSAQNMIALTAANVAVKMGEMYSRQQQEMSAPPVENEQIPAEGTVQ